MEILNVGLVSDRIAAKGLKKVWVIQELGLNHTSGFNLLSNGVFPKRAKQKARVLRKLAELLGLDAGDLVVQVGEGSAKVG